MGGKILDKMLQTPFLVYAIDDKDHFCFLIVNHIRLNKNEAILEGQAY